MDRLKEDMRKEIALQWEISMLQFLLSTGLISEEEYLGMIEIAREEAFERVK